MPQRIRDFGVAALALGAVFTALTLIDRRVPMQVTESISSVANGRAFSTGALGSFVMSVSANPALDNLFVVALLAAGIVLLVFMVRT
jgi:hypothetical protein